MKNCPSCQKGILLAVDDIIMDMDSYLFVVKGKRCTSCGEEIIEEQDGQKVVDAAKKIGVWGQPLTLHRKLSRSARGTVLRIPTDIEKNLHIKGNEEVSISKVGPKKLLIEIE